MDKQTVLITGGTGSFGQACVKRLLERPTVRQSVPTGHKTHRILPPVERVIVYSRDELKQYEQAAELDDTRLEFVIGDVRDFARLRESMRGVDVVIHAAALKQVVTCEHNPFEAVQTNCVGSNNVARAAMLCGVGRVLGLSTDKACAPLNLYGATKAVLERLLLANNKREKTAFSVQRYGNVAGSRGSAIPVFRAQVLAGKLLTVTDERMTRFWMSLDEAVDFALANVERMRGGEIFIPKLPSFLVADLARAIGGQYEVVGIRPGEKLHESLISEHELNRAWDRETYYVLTDRPFSGDQPVKWPYVSDGIVRGRLSVDELKTALEGV